MRSERPPCRAGISACSWARPRSRIPGPRSQVGSPRHRRRNRAFVPALQRRPTGGQRPAPGHSATPHARATRALIWIKAPEPRWVRVCCEYYQSRRIDCRRGTAMIEFPVLIDVYRRESGRLQRVEHLSLSRPGNYAIGRLSDSEIQLDAQPVSREHAFLALSRDGMRITDRASTNGTYIGDLKVEDAEPWDGSKPIRIEPYELHLQRSEQPQRPAPPLPAAPARREGAIDIELRPRTEIRLREERER